MHLSCVVTAAAHRGRSRMMFKCRFLYSNLKTWYLIIRLSTYLFLVKVGLTAVLRQIRDTYRGRSDCPMLLLLRLDCIWTSTDARRWWSYSALWCLWVKLLHILKFSASQVAIIWRRNYFEEVIMIMRLHSLLQLACLAAFLDMHNLLLVL